MEKLTNKPTQEAGKCVCLLINIRAAKFSNLLLTEDFRSVYFYFYSNWPANAGRTGQTSTINGQYRVKPWAWHLLSMLSQNEEKYQVNNPQHLPPDPTITTPNTDRQYQLKILQWNCNGIKNKLQELIDFVQKRWSKLSVYKRPNLPSSLVHLPYLILLWFIKTETPIKVSSPPCNFVIFKDRDLKFGDYVYFWILNLSYFEHHAHFLIRQPAFC